MDTTGGEISTEKESDVDPPEKKQDLCLEILPLVKEAQNQHGLRHGDYRSYRLYCSRRVRRIRKSLHFTLGKRHRYVGKSITCDMVTDVRFLQIPLVCAERAWAYAMQLKQDAESEYRKKHHLQRKLNKANIFAQELLTLCEGSPQCDPRTKLEADAYAKWMKGNLHFEKQEWKEAFDCFGSAQTIYEQLASAVLEDHRVYYHQRVNEITPSIRYCAYNIGDMPSDVKELTKLRVSTPGYELLASKIDVVIAQTRAKAASTLTEVSWCGKKLPVKSEKVRICLVHLRELSDEAQRKSDDDTACEQLCEQIVLECHEAMQTLRDELSQDKREGEKKVAKGEVDAGSLADLQSYVTHIKLTHSIRRNLLLIKLLQASQKKGRPEEYVRLYDSLLQVSSGHVWLSSFCFHCGVVCMCMHMYMCMYIIHIHK
jgi:signal recognition particle subunit SRP68